METVRISISMALILRVPTPLRCCRMPARIASLSLSCCLQPAPNNSAAEIPRIGTNFLMPRSLLFVLNQLPETCLSVGLLTVYRQRGERWQEQMRRVLQTESYLERSPLGTRGKSRRRAPVASKMALPIAGATAMIGVSPAPAEGISFRS